MTTDQSNSRKKFFEQLGFKDSSYQSFLWYERYEFESGNLSIIADVLPGTDVFFTIHSCKYVQKPMTDGWIKTKLFGKFMVYKDYREKVYKPIVQVKISNPSAQQVELLKKMTVFPQ